MRKKSALRNKLPIIVAVAALWIVLLGTAFTTGPLFASTTKPKGLYVPCYSNALTDQVIALKSNGQYPNLPIVCAINPASGPGDQYTSSTGPRSDIQGRINTMQNLPNITVLGYTGSWRAEATLNPPQGSTWPGSHSGVVYTVNQAQTNQILAAGGKSINLLTVVDKYAGVPVNGVTWYTGVDGLMVDEMANDGSTAKLQFYQTLINHAESRGMSYFKGNPGTGVNEAWFLSGCSNGDRKSTSCDWDNISVTEGSSFPTAGSLNGGNQGKYEDYSSFTRFEINTITQGGVDAVLPEVSMFFVTQDLLSPNPYDNQSIHLSNMASWIDAYNVRNGLYNQQSLQGSVILQQLTLGPTG